MAEETGTKDSGTMPNIKPDQGAKPAEGTGRFAAFDTRLRQYVGGVHDSEAKAKAAAKGRGVPASAVTVVEV